MARDSGPTPFPQAPAGESAPLTTRAELVDEILAELMPAVLQAAQAAVARAVARADIALDVQTVANARRSA